MKLSLSMKLILSVGLTFLLCIFIWASLNIKHQKEKMMKDIMANTDRLGNTIRLGAHYAMMLNSRDDINQIIKNVGRQKEIETIRIYNKEGRIKFSNQPEEVDKSTNIRDEACSVCHYTEPPLTRLSLEEKTRIFQSDEGHRLLGTISPIYSEPGCSGDCHFHKEGEIVLGALDLVVSLKETDKAILRFEQGVIVFAAILFFVTSFLIFGVVLKFVSRPIHRLIKETDDIARGRYGAQVVLGQSDEMALLAGAVNRMSQKIGEKQDALNRQVTEYQRLFDNVPCMISIQDRDYHLVRFNRKFAEKFDPSVGDYCYQAYKGLNEKCPNCPVEKTFEDGLSHTTEEAAVNRDGTYVYWMVMTAPIQNKKGEIVAAMEMSLDITHRKQLEEELSQSQKKYLDIFNNMPNPVFVLKTSDLSIIDCNDSVKSVYDYTKKELMNQSFLNFFDESEREHYESVMKSASVVNKAVQRTKNGRLLYVNIRISPSNNLGEDVYLVTTSDITKRLETEQQLMHAAKIATLGEMATGVAHELNQPLSFMKTTSSFFIDKIRQNQTIDERILLPMLEKIDANVDRASRIITHMRNFARKSDLHLEKVQINDIIGKALEIFSQQLKLREIEVIWEPDPDLPMVMGSLSQLEQVFINLLVNARDAIEENGAGSDERKIMLKTESDTEQVNVYIRDTGKGVSSEIADKIFEPFFTTKEVGKGTGLGLSISYGIVKECGGDIKFDKQYEHGACFKLTFPAASEQEEIY